MMVYKGIVKGNVVVLEAGATLPEGLHVEVMPVSERRQGNPAALLEVCGSDVPDAVWDAVEQAIEELDRADKENMRNKLRA
jgi:hypothetical protein